MQELKLPPVIVNIEGGAIVARPSNRRDRRRLLHVMRRDGLKKGIVTMCMGGGQGIALELEMID